MAIDASIYGLLKPAAPPPDPVEQYGKMMTLGNMMGQQEAHAGQRQLQEIQIREALRTEKSGIQMRDRLQNARGDPSLIHAAILESGDLKKLIDWNKSLLDEKKLKGEITEKEIKAARDKAAAFAQVIGPLAADPNINHDAVFAAGARLEQMGLAPQNWRGTIPMNAQELPTWAKRVALSNEGSLKALEAVKSTLDWKQRGDALIPIQSNALAPGFGGQATGVQPLRMAPTPGDLLTDARGRATLAEQIRATNMTDARARSTLNQGAQHYDSERGVLVDTRTGVGRPVTAVGGSPLPGKPANESQGKSSLFGTRAAEADKILNDLEGKYNVTGLATKTGMQTMPLVGGVLGAAGNVALSDNQQKAEQAQRNFVNAVLRVESGAVISPSEFANAQQQYFPQPGDSDVVIAQKRANRRMAISGLKTMAGPAGTNIQVPSERKTIGNKTYIRTGPNPTDWAEETEG